MKVEFICWNCKKENVYEHTEGETVFMELERRKEHEIRQAVRVSVYCANCDLENKVGLDEDGVEWGEDRVELRE